MPERQVLGDFIAVRTATAADDIQGHNRVLMRGVIRGINFQRGGRVAAAAHDFKVRIAVAGLVHAKNVQKTFKARGAKAHRVHVVAVVIGGVGRTVIAEINSQLAAVSNPGIFSAVGVLADNRRIAAVHHKVAVHHQVGEVNQSFGVAKAGGDRLADGGLQAVQELAGITEVEIMHVVEHSLADAFQQKHVGSEHRGRTVVIDHYGQRAGGDVIVAVGHVHGQNERQGFVMGKSAHLMSEGMVDLMHLVINGAVSAVRHFNQGDVSHEHPAHAVHAVLINFQHMAGGVELGVEAVSFGRSHLVIDVKVGVNALKIPGHVLNAVRGVVVKLKRDSAFNT